MTKMDLDEYAEKLDPRKSPEPFRDDEEADARRKPTSTETLSVESGRTVEEIAEEEEPTSFG